MKNTTLLFVMFLLIFAGCAKKATTPAKVKLNIAGIVASPAGTGGAMLFGRSSTGELLGKVVGIGGETLDLPNGDWTFYAFMWDLSSTPMNDVVFCGKSVQKLAGTEVSVAMTLSNSNCSDPELSNGKTYVDGSSKIRFADFFLEECDVVTAATGFTCGFKNQGSALSYRMIVRDFKKGPGAPFNFGAGMIASACQKVDQTNVSDLFHKGLPVNFPSGNGVTPFAVQIEMFIGNDTCTPDAKGVHTIVLEQGLGFQSGGLDKVVHASTMCSFTTPDFSGAAEVARPKCEDYLGTYNGSTCNAPAGGYYDTITRFAPTCTSQSPGNAAIKHLVSIPKSFLCDRYFGQHDIIGGHPFAGGNGSLERPYKICTEWQLNQIGEANAPGAHATSSYKLMNDLDMNKTDIIDPASKPSCSGYASGLLDKHHNLNPLDKITDNCTGEFATSGYSGFFNGNGKVISNGRIQAKDVTMLGLVRKLSSAGRVEDVFFKNLEVRGKSHIASVAGDVVGTNSAIRNIHVETLDLEGRSVSGTYGDFIGGIAGNASMGTLENVHVTNAKIRGRTLVGGLIGQSYVSVSGSHFRGSISTDEQSSSTTVGGIAGYSSGTITKSYSEGIIQASLQYVGGIAGRNNGSVNKSYSTMSLISNFSSGSAYMGGIVGDNNSGTMSDVFFDGILSYIGSGSPSINGIFALGSTASNCYSSHSVNASGCSQITSSNLRASLPAFSTPSDWNFTAGSLPRLVWENRGCQLASNQASVVAQASAGRGTYENPILICNNAQLSSLSARASTEYYKILDDLNLNDWTPASSVATFNGQLDGNGSIIHGLFVTYAIGDNSASYEGIFRSVSSTATIKKLKLYSNSIVNVAGNDDAGIGLLAGENLGVISEIDVRENSLHGYINVGQVVGHNKNIVKNIKINRGEVKGFISAGGVVGFNSSSGKIYKTSADLKIANSTSGTFESFGGIVGTNNGEVDQAVFRGKLETSISTGRTAGLRAGGIAGFNGGSILNTYTDNESSLMMPDTHVIGGLVGENTGSIARSFSLGKVVYSSSGITGTAADYFHPTVGLNSGSIASTVFFLENNIGSLKNSVVITGASCTGNNTTCTVSASLDSASDFFAPTYGNGGSIKNWSPLTSITGSTFQYNTGINYALSTNLDFYESYALADTTGQKTIGEIGTLNTFCAGGFNENTPVGVCTGGYDIAEMDGVGSDRIIGFYMALMSGLPAPANSPVWDFQSEDGYPKLLQLDD